MSIEATGIANAWQENRRRMANFRDWTRGHSFCREGLRAIALAWSPESALRSAALATMEDTGALTEAGWVVGRALSMALGEKLIGSDSHYDEADALLDADIVIASPEWRAMLAGTGAAADEALEAELRANAPRPDTA